MTYGTGLFKLTLKQIRLVVPWEKPTVNPTKRSRKCDWDSEQRQDIPHGLPDAYTTQYHRRTENIISYQDLSDNKWECSICGVKPRRRPARLPRSHYDHGGLTGSDGPHVHISSQPRRLPPENGYCSRDSARNRKVPEKSSSFMTSLP